MFSKKMTEPVLRTGDEFFFPRRGVIVNAKGARVYSSKSPVELVLSRYNSQIYSPENQHLARDLIQARNRIIEQMVPIIESFVPTCLGEIAAQGAIDGQFMTTLQHHFVAN